MDPTGPAALVQALCALDSTVAVQVITTVLQTRPELAVEVVNAAVPDLTYPPHTVLSQRRANGTIKHVDSAQGYGLIECPELKSVFGSDVFVHKNQLSAGVFYIGQKITFAVCLQKDVTTAMDNSLRAFDLMPAEDEWGDWWDPNWAGSAEDWMGMNPMMAMMMMKGMKGGGKGKGSGKDSPNADSPYCREVKLLQKTDAEAKLAWWSYCDRFGKGTKDPGRHDDAFLQKFLSEYKAKAGIVDTLGGAAGSGGLPQIGPPAGKIPPSDELIVSLKSLQRSDMRAKQLWWQYCDKKGRGVKDPANHESIFVEAFIEAYNSGDFAKIGVDVNEISWDADPMAGKKRKMGGGGPGYMGQMMMGGMGGPPAMGMGGGGGAGFMGW